MTRSSDYYHKQAIQDELTNQRRRNYNREYLACADFCPVCRADDIEASDAEFDGMSGSYTVRCNVCESTWLDLYTLQGYQITKAMTWESNYPETGGRHVDLLS